MRDIYTGKPIGRRSSEHVLPAFLGGRLESSQLIDASTNQLLGDTIETRLESGLHSLRVLTDAASSRGGAPRALQAEGADSERYVVHGNGTIRLVTRSAVTEVEGGLSLNALGTTLDEVLRAVGKNLERRGLSFAGLVAQVQALATEQTTAAPAMSFSTSIWDPESTRATAKFACNLLALHDRDLFLRPEFDPIRRFVLSGASKGVSPVLPARLDPSSFAASPLGPADHLILVRGDPDARRVRGLVVYFGALACAVDLATDVMLSRPFAHAYRVSQVATAAARTDSLFDLAIALPRWEELAALDYDVLLELVRAQVQAAASVGVATHDCSGIIQRVIRAAAKQPSLTAHELSAFIATEVCEALLPMLRAAGEERRRKAEKEFQASLDGEDLPATPDVRSRP